MKHHYHFSTMSMEDMIFEMSAEQLRKMSAIWSDFSKRALCRARTLEEREKLQNKTRTSIESNKNDIPQKIIRALENGASLKASLSQINAEYKAPEGYAEAIWTTFIRASDNYSSSLRRQLIFELASRGFSNGEISHKLGMHKVSVSRIISQQKKERARTQNALTRS